MKSQSENERETLGAFLRRTREGQGLTLEQAFDSTKISPNCLKALEEDDYANLPADAFVRGFYGIYARYLSLDPDEIRNRYQQQKKHQPKKDETNSPTPGELAIQTSSMAEPPSVTSYSVVGLSLLALLVFWIVACWYFSFNPFTSLSRTLRGASGPVPIAGEPATTPPATPDQSPTSSSSLPPPSTPETPGTPAPQLPSQGNTASTQPTPPASVPPSSPAGQVQAEATGVQTAPPQPAAAGDRPGVLPVPATYTLKATFREATRTTVRIDDQPAQHFEFAAGAVHSWDAGKSIIISLPAGTGTALTLNNLPLTLPSKAAGEEITVTIPQGLSE
jgi:cytoskeletal protein RodZ